MPTTLCVFAVLTSLLAAGAAGCGTTPRTSALRVFRQAGPEHEDQAVVASAAHQPDEVLDAGYVTARRRPDAPKNLVFITHGSDLEGIPDRWLFDCKDKIFKRTGLTDPDLRVVVYDWANYSFAGLKRHYLTGTNRSMRPYTFLAAKSAAKLLIDGGHLHSDSSQQHIHLIVHSRGGGVGSLLIRILTEAGVKIDHLTLLDGLDPLGPHADMEKINDPPLRPDLAGWCDNYFCDGFHYGLLDLENYYLSGSARRLANMNVHFKYLTHVESHDLYMASIDDRSIPWGWQWSKLGGGWDPKRREDKTIDVDLPRVFIEGTLAELADIHHEVWFTPEGSDRRKLRFESLGGPGARYLRPGKYEVVLRRMSTGETVPATHQIVRHKFGAGPAADTSEMVTEASNTLFTIKLTDIGTDHIFRPAACAGEGTSQKRAAPGNR